MQKQIRADNSDKDQEKPSHHHDRTAIGAYLLTKASHAYVSLQGIQYCNLELL
jgi:hypothetical protein